MVFRKNASQSGFTLIQLSILLTAAALVMVAILPGYQGASNSNKTSINKTAAVLNALKQYEVSNGVLPCPADPTIATGNTNYGIAAATTTNCTGGTPAAAYSGTGATFNSITYKIAIGMIPVKTLGLSSDYAIDGFGRNITYAVDTSATSCWGSQSLPGAITINDNGVTQSSVVALVSHGADGYGAWQPTQGTGSSGTAKRLLPSSTFIDASEASNAQITTTGSPNYYYSSTNSGSAFSNFVNKPPTSTFDDLVSYKIGSYNLNMLPVNNPNPLMVSYPPGATYTSSQTITFVLQFPSIVTVSGGTPYLAFTPITTTGVNLNNANTGCGGTSGTSGTGWACYVSGSGTSQLTFQYTVQGTDYTPKGLIMSTPISFNGASLYGVTSTCFIPPNLSSVILTTAYVYVGDTTHHRVVKLDASGNYVATYGNGTSTTTDNGFQNPGEAIADIYGNLWVLDSGGTVDRVIEFSSSNNWLMSIGGGAPTSATTACSGITASSTTCTPLSGLSYCCAPNASSCNCPAGSATTIASMTSTNGQFNFYTGAGGLAFDVNGNVWVADTQNSRILEFYTTGSHAGTYESALTTSNGLLIGRPLSVAFDPSGNLWAMSPGATYNCELEKCTYSSGWSCTAVTTACGTSTGQFYNNSSDSDYISIDNSGNVFVADESNCRIQEFNNSGVYVTSIAVSPCTTNNGPSGVSVDNNGHIWVTNAKNSSLIEYNISDGSTVRTITTVNSVGLSQGTVYVSGTSTTLSR